MRMWRPVQQLPCRVHFTPVAAVLRDADRTTQSCGFRDHHDEFLALKGKVFGLSTQTTEYQKEMVDRLHVPFDVLSDQDLSLTRALRLPTFEFAGMTLIKRLTFVVRNGAVEHVFYPVFPPDRHAEEVLGWLRNAPGA